MSQKKINPELRNDARANLHGALHGAIAGSIGLLFNPANYPFKTCLNCIRFIENTEICALYSQRPPARVIAFGCSSYSDSTDEIPF